MNFQENVVYKESKPWWTLETSQVMRPAKKSKSTFDCSCTVDSGIGIGPKSSRTSEEETDSSEFQTEDEEFIDEEELLTQLKAEENWTDIENIQEHENGFKKERMTDDEIKTMVKTLQRNPRFQKIGEQKLLHAIRQMESNFETSKFIVTTTRAKPLPRRVRVPWEPWEVKYLSDVHYMYSYF